MTDGPRREIDSFGIAPMDVTIGATAPPSSAIY
jgi:hypothetical protein